MKKSASIALPIVLAAIWIILFLCRPTEIVGVIHDDSVYLITAKALAEGKGYHNIQLVYPFAQVKYPFLYPLILSVGWLINPNFPGNLPLFSAITNTLTVLGFGVYFFYLRNRHQFPTWLALLLLVFIAGNFDFIYYFSNLMSEAPYLLFSMLTLAVVGVTLEPHQDTFSLRKLIILILLSSLTFYSRIVGLSLIAAISLWLLLQRNWKSFLVYTAGCLTLTVIPWVCWVKLSVPTPDRLHEPLVLLYSSYSREFSENLLRMKSYPQMVLATFGILIYKIPEAFFNGIANLPLLVNPKYYMENKLLIRTFLIVLLVFNYAIAGYFCSQGVRTVMSAIRAKSVRSFSISALYLLIYLLMIVFWGYDKQADRFLVVITPLLWLYFFKPLLPALTIPTLPSWKKVSAYAFVFCVAVASLYTFESNVITNHTIIFGNKMALHAPDYWPEYKATFNYIRRNKSLFPPSSPLAASYDTLFYLWTEHPTFPLHEGALVIRKEQVDSKSLHTLMDSMRFFKVRYLVLEPYTKDRTFSGMANPVAVDLLKMYPHTFTEIYHSPYGYLHIFKISPIPEKPVL